MNPNIYGDLLTFPLAPPSCCVTFCLFAAQHPPRFVGDGHHGEEAGGTGQQDGLNSTFGKQQQEIGSNRQSFEFMGNIEPLLRCFMDRSDVLIKTEFIVCSESNIFQVVDLFCCLAMDGGGFSQCGLCLTC